MMPSFSVQKKTYSIFTFYIFLCLCVFTGLGVCIVLGLLELLLLIDADGVTTHLRPLIVIFGGTLLFRLSRKLLPDTSIFFSFFFSFFKTGCKHNDNMNDNNNNKCTKQNRSSLNSMFVLNNNKKNIQKIYFFYNFNNESVFFVITFLGLYI